MKAIVMKGHTRPVVHIAYNLDGDLLFTCGKEGLVTMWRADNGERIGTYDHDEKAVWSCDVSYDSKFLVTGSADQSMRIWEVETGKVLADKRHTGTVRSVRFAGGQKQVAMIYDKFAQTPGGVLVYNVNMDGSGPLLEDSPAMAITNVLSDDEKFLCLEWGPLNEHLYVGCADGTIKVFDAASGEKVDEVAAHGAEVQSLKFNRKKTLMLTASKDKTGKLWDVMRLECLKTYKVGTLVNACDIAPSLEHVMLAGGQEARDVTTTAAGSGKFEVRFHHMVTEEELGKVAGHFGPVNTCSFSPDGNSYASGGEDGFVRMHHLPSEYHKLGYDEEAESEDVAKLVAAEGGAGEEDVDVDDI
jgi:translation initiation factor 3 subunit I